MTNRPVQRLVHIPNSGKKILCRQLAHFERLNFTFEPNAEACDYLIGYGDLPGPVTSDIPRERRIFFVLEPPGILDYPPDFLSQFGVLVSPYPLEGFKGRTILSQPAMRWWLGINVDGPEPNPVMDFDALAGLSWPKKSKMLSVVASTKTNLPKHRARLAFIERATKRFAPEMDVFGRGFQPIADKADAILPYRYHLVIENNDIPNFWTEKLADAYLGFAFPFFSGCRNLADYFPAESFLAIDIDDPERALDAIEAAIGKDLAGQCCPQIEEARRRILYEHNLFALIERILGELDHEVAPTRPSRPEIIYPANKPSRLKDARRWIRSRLGVNRNLRRPRR